MPQSFKERSRTNPWLQLYIQFSGIAGALSLVQITSNIVAWRKLFVDFSLIWAEFARPIAQVLFGWLYAYLHIELTDQIKDYLVIGMLMGGGVFRLSTFERIVFENHGGKTVEKTEHPFNFAEGSGFAGTLGMVLLGMLLWPIALVILFVLTLSAFRTNDFEDAWDMTYFAFTPAIYFGVLLILNYLWTHAAGQT